MPQPEPKRVPSGVPGLDDILLGGFRRGAVVLLDGPPGAGKTVLANQICFGQAAREGTALYLTLLSESHQRMLGAIQALTFFDAERVPDRVTYLSAFEALRQEGWRGLVQLVTREARARRATLVVLDGLFAVQVGEVEFRQFVNEVASLAGLLDCVVLLVASDDDPVHRTARSMVDAWITLLRTTERHRARRALEVIKIRGSDFLSGRHELTISDAGVRVLPRLEGRRPEPPGPAMPTVRYATGVPGLDALIGGGLPDVSSTVLVGPTGVGKTNLGLHFLSGCSPDQPGLLFGFYEPEQVLRRRAARMRLPLVDLLDRGVVEVERRPPAEQVLDELGYRLLDAVRRRGVRRLFFDGIDAVRESTLSAERLGAFLAALAEELRRLGVTSIFVAEGERIAHGNPLDAIGDLSAVASNVILLRFVATDDGLVRTVSVVKMRESHFDHRAHGYTVEDRGLVIGGPVAWTPQAGVTGPLLEGKG